MSNNKSLVKHASRSLVQSKSVSGTAGRGMIMAGGGGLALYGMAAVLPFVGMIALCIMLIAAGFFLAE